MYGASFVFQAGATPQTGLCPGICFQVHVFFEDDSGSLALQAVQFDIDVLGASVPV